MKKLLCVLLAVLLGTLGGCAAGPGGKFAADNEIATYQRIDPDKTQIVVSRTGNIEVEAFCEAFEAANPDVQVVYLDITGGNDGYKPLVDWFTKGYAPDVAISAMNFFDDQLKPSYFVNLSTDPIIQNYQAAALKRTAIDGEIYALPGPSDIIAMMYNKTLFAKYGWEVPTTFDEFVALCDRIRADTNGEIEPWNPNAKYSKELLTAIDAMTYAAVFGGADNRAWYNDFLAGKATFAGHMEPYMQAVQTLIDHDILREEHFAYSATTRGKEFHAGKIAMINMSIYDADNDEFDFGYMPFPTTTGDMGYVSDTYSCYVAVPVKEHTAKEQAAIERLLAFFSSAEGQQAYIGRSMKVSNVKGVPFNQSGDLAALQPVIEAGHMFAVMEFKTEGGQKKDIPLHEYAADMAAGKLSGAECIALADAATPAVQSEPPQKEVLAVIPADMTILETSFFIADAYRAATGADIGLITHNQPYRGNLMRLFAGDMTPEILTVLKPRSFANDSTLVKLAMTGQQILDAMNDPSTAEGEADCIYAFSGLRCEVAPWNARGSKYLSVKLADGKPLDPSAVYTVGVWDGSVNEAHITEKLASYEGSWEDIMRAQIEAAGQIVPAKDGRIKLVWK